MAKHQDIRHRMPVDKETMIKSIAYLLWYSEGETEDITKKAIRDNLSWITWYNGYGAIEDQEDCIRRYYPKATKIYLKLYPK